MKKVLSFLLIAVFFASCITMSQISTTSGVDEAYLYNIPANAQTVIVQKEGTADDLYDEVYSILLSRGHRVLKDDAERHYITTEGKDVGLSTLQRMQLVVTEFNNMATLRITTEWKPGTEATNNASAAFGQTYQTDWANAKWGVSRLGIAFAESVSIAKKITDAVVSYE